MALQSKDTSDSDKNIRITQNTTNIHNITYLGVMIAVAMVASYLESLLPAFVAVPGVKIGLANGVTMFILYKRGVKDALIVSVIRIVLSGILFSGLLTVVYSLAGAALSMLAMVIARKTDAFSTVGVSVLGGVLHNVGQIIVAALLIENEKIAFYLPVLMISGVIAGIVVGIITGQLIKRVPDR